MNSATRVEVGCRFHVVRIYSDGYKRSSSHVGLAEGARAALGTTRVTSGVVLRDGTTGKRYSIEEIQKLGLAS